MTLQTTALTLDRQLVAFALVLMLCAATPAAAKEQTAHLNTQVAAGEVQVTRLRDLPDGAYVRVVVEIDGKASVMLLDEQNVTLPRSARKPLVSGETSDRMSLAARIPAAGNYYVLVDNESGTTERQYSLAITAGVDSTPGSEDMQQKLTRINAEFEQFEQNLRRYFMFDELTFRLARCGTANAYSNADTIVICAEIGPKLREVMGDDAKALDALHFAMIHEVGHVLLQQWGYPFHDNEEVADEFATALLLLFEQGERARSQAEYFSRIPAEKEFALKRSRDDRHPLSQQRARNILGWLGDPMLLQRWQKIFIPHMQTEVLDAMTRSNKAWIERELVARELALRAD